MYALRAYAFRAYAFRTNALAGPTSSVVAPTIPHHLPFLTTMGRLKSF